MTLLLNPRVLITLAIVALLTFSHFTAYRKGKANVRMEWAAATAEAEKQSRSLEQRRQSAVDAATRIAAASAHRDAIARAGARDELDSMRGTLDLIERASAESHDAATKSVAALSAVFGDCSREYLRMAEEASGHARDSLTYQQGWPK